MVYEIGLFNRMKKLFKLYFWMKQNWAIAFLIVFILSFAVRFIYIESLSPALVWYDEIQYNNRAVQLLHGERLTSYEFAPGQIYFIYLIYKVFGQSVFIARLVQAFLSALAVVFLFWLGFRLFSFKVGLLASVLMSMYPYYIFACGTLYPVVLFSSILLLLVILVYESISKRSIGLVGASGLLMGLETLIIPAMLFMMPIFVIWLFIQWKGKGRWNSVMLLLVSFVVVVAPWSYYVSSKLHKFVMITSESGHSLWQGNNEFFDGFSRPSPDDVPPQMRALLKGKTIDEQDAIYRREAIRFIENHPIKFVRLYFKKFINFWRIYPKTISKNQYTSNRNKIISIFSYGILLLFSLFGLCYIRDRFLYLSLMPLSAIFLGLGYSLFLTSTRYRMPIDSFIILFASVALARWLKTGSNKLFSLSKAVK